ncbi:MAG: class I SAM-dependent methyltransferase, partial [Planctomycetota bacterium]|nr:class I SAM-dependent methyltransferase [Planctomycetota bacterium]
NSHKLNQAAFLQRGGSTLSPDELELLGDCSSADLVRLQCNCGQDSLSLAQLGARLTGIDIAGAPIAFAR